MDTTGHGHPPFSPVFIYWHSVKRHVEVESTGELKDVWKPNSQHILCRAWLRPNGWPFLQQKNYHFIQTVPYNWLPIEFALCSGIQVSLQWWHLSNWFSSVPGCMVCSGKWHNFFLNTSSTSTLNKTVGQREKVTATLSSVTCMRRFLHDNYIHSLMKDKEVAGIIDFINYFCMPDSLNFINIYIHNFNANFTAIVIITFIQTLRLQSRQKDGMLTN